MEILWEVEDGYAGKSRPQHTMIDDEEIQECETLDEAIEVIEGYVQNDLNNNISWSYRDDGLRAKLEKMIKA